VVRLQKVDATYLSIFKALAPCIEGLLRNLCQLEGIEVRENEKRINTFIKVIKDASKPILKISTLEVIDGIFRPYRNVVEHGHVYPPEPARMLCELALWGIENIHRDYLEYKETAV
jgi:hypothetical protein